MNNTHRWRNPSWTVLLEKDQLVLSGGADALFLVDEVDAAGAKLFHQAWHQDRWDLLAGHAELQALRERLEVLGALLPAQPARASLSVALVFAGDRDEAAATSIAEMGRSRGITLAASPDTADVVLVYRSNGTLIGAAELAPPHRPHLLLDLAYQRSISLGPLVFPGETACLGCFVGRISMGWGDPPPPPEPAANGARELGVALLLSQLEPFAKLGTCPALVERVLSINLDSLETQAHRVHRLPWCSRCFPGAAGWGAGSFSLPWTS
jgi:hypothetical protein